FPGILPWQDTDCVNRVSVYASPRNDERPLIAALGIGWAEVCFCLRRCFCHVLRFADLAATYSPAS
ncbi:hypothetical protein, partial [Agrobacterium rosae]|uniref:hypothetical protein n=1 Tax=Agrobacterium rosae TaxID=1972867 RepID=UPI003B9FED45